MALATDGTTIELLANATTNGLNLSKNLTIQAATGLEVRPTVTFNQYGIALWGKNLTFKNIDVEMNGIGSTPYTGEWSWMTICASTDASLTLDNVNMTMDATGTTNSPHAIYFCNNNVLNIINGSNLTIKNYGNDALSGTAAMADTMSTSRILLLFPTTTVLVLREPSMRQLPIPRWT